MKTIATQPEMKDGQLVANYTPLEVSYTVIKLMNNHVKHGGYSRYE